MKKYFYLIFFLLAAYVFLLNRDLLFQRVAFLNQSPCDNPINYRIGQLDKDYGQPQEDFLRLVNQSADIWNQAQGKQVFAYSPAAELTVNLIYSERQSILDELLSLESQLAGGRGSLDSMISEYSALSAEFKKKTAEFNELVLSWNERGGAPGEVYEKLISQQEDLKAEARRLNDLAARLNLSVEEYNLEVSRYNQNVGLFNTETEKRPEAGLYDGSVPKIDIYLTVSEKELVHTLAHELGHARGLEHISDAGSIMYPYSSEVIELSDHDRLALEKICREKNWEIFLWRLIEAVLERMPSYEKID